MMHRLIDVAHLSLFVQGEISSMTPEGEKG